MTDIVERLRTLASWTEENYRAAIAWDGADEITRLRADVARLEKLFEAGGQSVKVIGLECARLRAENERMRKVLHRISLGSQNSMTSKEDLGRTARAELEAVLAAPLSRNRRRRTPMTDITIPPEAVEAAAKAAYDLDAGSASDTWEHADRLAKTIYRGNARATLLAGLAAWPGMEISGIGGGHLNVILPLPPQENPDAASK